MIGSEINVQSSRATSVRLGVSFGKKSGETCAKSILVKDGGKTKGCEFFFSKSGKT
jgi:hypothetical protein